MFSLFQKNKDLILPLLIITGGIVFLFKDLTKTFYQQDEWHGLGLVFSDGINSVLSGTSRPIDILFVKGRLLSNAIFYLFATFFPFQNTQMAYLAISLHITAAFLTFLLIKRLIGNIGISLLGAVFFAVNSVSHGGVTWAVVSISTVGSTILVLVSTFFFLNFIEANKSMWLILSGITLYLSLWFKETGLYLFIFFPVAALLFKKYNFKSYISQFWLFIVPFLLIAGYRVLELRLRTTDSNLYLTGANENFFLTILIRMILYPLTSLSLMFVPGGPFINFARDIMRVNYSYLWSATNNLLIAQSVILDLLAVVLTCFILLTIFVFLLKEKTENKKKVIFWLAFTLLSFSPYVLLDKDFAYLESRYYYLPVVGGAVILSWLLARMRQILGNKPFLFTILPLYLVFIFFHAQSVRTAIKAQIVLSDWRTSFIAQLKNQVPTLNNNKNVFYITSNQTYWTDSNKIPFQQGSGYTLMVLYYDSGKIPKELLKDGYLFEIGSQGYRESEGVGFGHFWDREALKEALKANNLPQGSVIELYYNSEKRSLSREK